MYSCCTDLWVKTKADFHRMGVRNKNQVYDLCDELLYQHTIVIDVLANVTLAFVFSYLCARIR